MVWCTRRWHWVLAPKGKGMQDIVFFGGSRSGPNLITGIVTVQWSRTSDTFTWFRFYWQTPWRSEPAKSSRKQWSWPIMHTQMGGLSLSGPWWERGWRDQDSRMITKYITISWHTVWVRRATFAQCSAWTGLQRMIGWRWVVEWSRQLGIG